MMRGTYGRLDSGKVLPVHNSGWYTVGKPESFRQNEGKITDDLLRFRSEFPILERSTYMISNSLGAMPRGVYDSVH